MEFQTPELCEVFFSFFWFSVDDDTTYSMVSFSTKNLLQQMRSAHFSNDFVIGENVFLCSEFISLASISVATNKTLGECDAGVWVSETEWNWTHFEMTDSH